MKCPQCQFDNPDTQKFCGECATPLTSSGEPQPSFTRTLETPVEALTRGTLFADRYEIIEELGKGGMGKVYRVEDTKTQEEVALKLINSEVAADKKTIERFRNELTTARKIRQKNICGMYDLGEDKGTHFITMEYVPGEDLKSFLKRTGRLTVSKAVSIAKQICEGLSEAHRLGVVHRDLKPSNIMIDGEGNARIMDFGIACSLRTKGLTGSGVMIGTPEYMSPEQAEAKDVHHRSDIYSLGVILYEMVTGQVPFVGDTALSIAMKHKMEEPTDPRILNDQVSEDLSRVVLWCLKKDEMTRCQTAQELLSELTKIEKRIPIIEGIRTAEVSRSEIMAMSDDQNSIAVLPFTNMSVDPEQEYFCDGMAEEVINSLTKIKDLRVVARTSAFSFKGKNLDIREIGKKLNVGKVLEGSVRIAGNRIRITAQLINVADGYHLWSDRYDRELEDVFAIQDDVTMAIVDNLKLKLVSQEKASVLKRGTDDVEAYNLYLKGSHYFRMYGGTGFDEAIDCYQQALQKDPTYSMAYYGLSEVYVGMSYWGNVPPKEAIPKAKAYAKKALVIDETNGEAHGVLGFIHTIHDWDWKAAERELKQALELNPNSAINRMYYSWLLSNSERHEEAINEAMRAKELDPISSFINAFVGLTFFCPGQFVRAAEELQKVLTMSPDSYLARYHLGMVYSAQSNMKGAMAEYEKAIECSDGVHFIEMLLAIIYYDSGKKEEAEKQFERLMQRTKHEYVPPTSFFLMNLVLGKLGKAQEWLNRAGEEHDSYLCWIRIIPSDFYLHPGKSGFKALIKKTAVKMMVGKTISRYRIVEKNNNS
ncbi:MAG: protein kinase [Deltaproteobacteria bacterium]|nr:protein kinase [Deltaproteobacteria bacterium]